MTSNISKSNHLFFIFLVQKRVAWCLPFFFERSLLFSCLILNDLSNKSQEAAPQCRLPYKCLDRTASSHSICPPRPRRRCERSWAILRSKLHSGYTPGSFWCQSRVRCVLCSLTKPAPFKLRLVSLIYGLEKRRNYRFSSNQLSMFTFMSKCSPKLPGLEEVTKNWGLSGTKWVPVSFLLSLWLYSLISPKLLTEPAQK